MKNNVFKFVVVALASLAVADSAAGLKLLQRPSPSRFKSSKIIILKNNTKDAFTFLVMGDRGAPSTSGTVHKVKQVIVSAHKERKLLSSNVSGITGVGPVNPPKKAKSVRVVTSRVTDGEEGYGNIKGGKKLNISPKLKQFKDSGKHTFNITLEGSKDKFSVSTSSS